MTRRTRLWLATGAAVLLAVIALSVLAPDSTLFGLVVAVLWLWLALGVAVALWRIWRWLTYRVSVRLLLSYLLLGVTPFLICIALGGVILYMTMGQYTSVRFGTEIEVVAADLQRDCVDIATAYASAGLAPATEEFERAASRPRRLASEVLWRATLGDVRLATPDGVRLPDLHWVDAATVATARSGDDLYLLVAASVLGRGGSVAALIPLDDGEARTLSRALWFDVLFASLDDDRSNRPSSGELDTSGSSTGSRSGDQATADPSAAGQSESEAGRQARRSGDSLEVDGIAVTDAWEPWPEGERGMLHKPWIYWFRLTVDVVDLATGSPSESAISLLRSSPARIWEDFTRSRYELGSHLWGALMGLGLFLLVLYALALAIAGTMIVSMTRSTTRLSKGARAVEEGRLDYRIPVKRRDQLGDLALSFNRMAASVEGMLADVAEKERLARELELAREIQESLLPDRHLRHGTLAVHAIFRPAAAVGGDYFDIFPLDDSRLVVVVGDVAGHGLHAGLLMASLKSMVAALIHEGYTGGDLLERVNALLSERRSGTTMATLAVIEIDTVIDRVLVTNAGHPPAYLIANGGAEELMVSSLPLGSPLAQPGRMERPFPPGARILVYSDGLVEACDPSGEPFGYDRLEATVRRAATLPAGEFELAVVGAVDRFVEQRSMADDLTLLVIERASAGEAAGPTVS